MLRLGAGKQHAIVQCVQVSRLADPSFLVDEDAMHHRDLTGWAAETQQTDLQPDTDGIAERNICDTPFNIGFGLRGHLTAPNSTAARFRHSA